MDLKPVIKLDINLQQLYTFIFITFCLGAFSQNDCAFVQDTLSVPSLTTHKDNKVVNVEYVQTALKNRSTVQIFKTETNRFFLKLTVTENLYFNQTEKLEIRSGKKQSWTLETKQYQKDKFTGYYLIEVFRNYIGTLKDDGITAIVFGHAETNFSKQDCSQIKQISKCFYDKIAVKK